MTHFAGNNECEYIIAKELVFIDRFLSFIPESPKGFRRDGQVLNDL